MTRKNKVLIVVGVLVLLVVLKLVPLTLELFHQRKGPFEESVLQAFGVNEQEIYNVQMTFYGEGELNAESQTDYAPVLEYLLSLNAASVFPQSSVPNQVSDRIIFLDFNGGSLSVYLLDDHHFAVWGKESAAGYTAHHVYKTDEAIDTDFLRGCFNHFFK